MHYVILPWFKMITWYDDLFNATVDYWAWNFQFILFQFDFPVLESCVILTCNLKELLPTNDVHDISVRDKDGKNFWLFVFPNIQFCLK